MYAAYLFFSLWLPNCSVPAFKNFSQYPIKHELSYRSFLHYIFISILIILHHYYCVGVVEHSRCIHTNISIGFHIPELQQSRPQYGEITVFWMNLWGNCVDGIWWKFGYTSSVTFLTVSASHFHQIIVHYRIVLAILSPSTFPWFSKLHPHDLDSAICSICRFWDATWANVTWCKFHVDRTTGKCVLNSKHYYQPFTLAKTNKSAWYLYGAFIAMG